jgi:hypothetical protein
MPTREHDDLPYLSNVPKPGVPKQVRVNESEYSTLRQVRDLLAATVDGLSKNFNAFEVLKKENLQLAAVDLLRQVEVKQGVFEILDPLLAEVNEAMITVDARHKEE